MPEWQRCGQCGAEPEPDDVFCQRCGARLGPGRDTGARVDGARPAPAPTASRRDPGDDISEATRFLCVGAHVDDRFARRVLEELFGQAHRAVAPSYGFDVGLVSAHCLAARHRRRVRDLLLTVFAVAMFLFGAVPTVAAGLFWWVVGWLFGSLRHGTDGLRDTVYRVKFRSVVLAFVVGWLALVVAGIWSFVLTAVQMLTTRTAPAALPGAQAAGALPLDAVTGAVVGLFVGGLVTFGGWAVLYTIVLWDLVARRLGLVRELGREAFRARPERQVPVSRRLQERLDAITWGQLGNVTVYSRFNPFVGTGQGLAGWSFAVPFRAAPGRSGAVESFEVAELVRHVRARIEDIAASEDGAALADPGSENPLRGLAVSDHVFVSGHTIEGDRRFLPARGASPRSHLGREEVEGIAGQPRGPVRHYTAVHVRSWEGEVVTSMFLHFSTDGEKLYFQCVKRVLLPIRRRYHEVDDLPPHLRVEEFIGLAAEAAALTVPLVVGAPGRIIDDLLFDLRSTDPPADAPIDYGARFSVRELGSEAAFHNYFQELDVDKHLKVVEHQALEAICEFLDDHGIDTSEFSDRQGSILNNGIIQIGGNNAVGAATFGGGTATQQGTIDQQGASPHPRPEVR